jgi:hypothetical protein
MVVRAKILRLQDAMLAEPEQVECSVEHIFAPGLYARQMLIPKGTVIVGKIHKHAHVNTISKGRCSVMTEFGPKEIAAPCTFVSEPGTKRVVVALEDVIWTTYHPTEETDLEKIEAHVIAKDYQELAELSGHTIAPQVEEKP